jgi:nucleoside-diphosphate-sugar epimerase
VDDDTVELTVAVTGPTGTFGSGLMPLLQADPRVGRVIGIARRPFDPHARGWTKMEYRQGDVRDEDALRAGFQGADVVVHLAFLVVGGKREIARAINVDGTLNAFRAAVDVGADRFVYASSVAAYGFHPDNPVGMTEEWPTRPAERLFYAQEKAELEQLLGEEAAKQPGIGLYLLRPSLVVGPHAVGAKAQLPAFLSVLGRGVVAGLGRARLRPPVPVPDLPLQLVHEEDVGQALLQCVVAAGPPGAYNIAGPGVLRVEDLARELGLTPLPLPARLTQTAARLAARLPRLPTLAEWVEAAAHPAIMDTMRARDELGWKPRYTGLEAFRDTLARRAGEQR